MRTIIAALAVVLMSGLAHAADPSCADKAAEKKLKGAAKNSFVKKCEKDTAVLVPDSCTAKAAEKKLHGAAKNSFVKKCAADAAAPAASGASK
ncbi:MAG: hypothetical protein EOP38_05025 [Rubrivivax sp.]|nr:MAG: hypothetical protein EOP38_05025 [Rubrivivax sp.]